jgi:hypothetical protein
VCPSPTPDEEETLVLWYELGGLYARAGEGVRRSVRGGFVAVFVAAALVLVSAPLFGTSWAGPFAAVIPVVAGLLSGGGSLGWRRLGFARRRNVLHRTLAKRGEYAGRPTAEGLRAYYDAQLILLRCEYEFLKSRGTKRALLSANLFEASFGFTPEDGFECGPLNVAPDTRDAGAQGVLGVASLGEEGARGVVAGFGTSGGLPLSCLPTRDDRSGGAGDAGRLSGDLLRTTARTLRQETGGRVR